MSRSNVQLLHRDKIDLQAWDAAVTEHAYGLSWWLDAVTDGRWWGIVAGDYRCVIPLPVRLNAGPLKLVDSVPFTQHCGPHGLLPADPLELLKAVPNSWRIRSLRLYLANVYPAANPRFNFQPRTNYELDLNAPYTDLAKGYRADLRRKLRDHLPTPPDTWDAGAFVAFYREHTGNRFGMKAREYKIMRRLLDTAEAHGAGNIYVLRGTQDEPVAALFIARRGRRLINLMASSSTAGFRQHGMARLLDAVIREFAGRNFLLDFEGSDIKGVATFFRGFGAERVAYQQLGDHSLVPTIFP